MMYRVPAILKRCTYPTAERGYEDGKQINRLWKEHEVKPVIDVSNLWKDAGETKRAAGRDHVACNYEGTFYCYSPKDLKKRLVIPGSFEKDRDAPKYLSSADAHLHPGSRAPFLS